MGVSARRLGRLARLAALIGVVLGALPPQVLAQCAWPCGQVRVQGAVLADDGGAWRMRGVQLFLPQYGINGKTFADANYAQAAADGSLDLWLDRASGYLHANELRIFVDLPSLRGDGTLATPTSYATLLDFAARAGARRMRLAISLHNSADWTMTSERAAWIDGMLAAFASQGSLPLIAYLSADNEINNHCTNSGRDCFDATGEHDAQRYVDGALDWTARFRSVVKARAPQMLVTAGISTEMVDADATRAAFNFFRPDSQGRRLVDILDFLAPHNYSGGAGAVIDDLRVGAGYAGAVVLEEFGFPTDPAPRDPLWTEGPPACRLNPLASQCVNTAPWFVAQSLIAADTRGYAGAVAWMLADVAEKNVPDACADPGVPFDLWTGLFSIGGAYCPGGTYSTAPGQPKATAFLVCWAYIGDINRCDDPLRPLFKTRLPLVMKA
jgi:hypothetical protein